MAVTRVGAMVVTMAAIAALVLGIDYLLDEDPPPPTGQSTPAASTPAASTPAATTPEPGATLEPTANSSVAPAATPAVVPVAPSSAVAAPTPAPPKWPKTTKDRLRRLIDVEIKPETKLRSIDCSLDRKCMVELEGNANTTADLVDAISESAAAESASVALRREGDVVFVELVY